jgi:hypothetical protein
MVKSLKAAALFGILGLLMPLKAGAAPITQNGIAISPAIVSISLNPNQNSTTFNETVTNNSSTPAIVEVSTTNFTALNTSGTVNFLNSNSPGNDLHGLSRWLKPSRTQIILAANTTQTISISIIDINSLAPGGHYGALLFKIITAAPTSKGNVISANTELSSLVFLTTSNGATNKVSLFPPSISSIAFSMPNTLDLAITNTGNDQTTPRGVIIVTDKNKKEISRGVINGISGLVLPGTTRLYEVTLKYNNKVLIPGIYHVNIKYQAANNSLMMMYTKSFLYLNVKLLIIVVIFAFSVIFLAFRLTNKYTKKHHRT